MAELSVKIEWTNKPRRNKYDAEVEILVYKYGKLYPIIERSIIAEEEEAKELCVEITNTIRNWYIKSGIFI